MKKTIICTAISMLMIGCGGGGSSSSGGGSSVTPLVAPAQLSGTVSSVNTTSETIEVNGYSIDASSASLTYGEESIALETIQAGMKVAVGSNNNIANVIEIDPSMVGEVTAVSGTRAAGSTITVNGVELDSSGSNTTFQVTDWVAVNGYQTETGEWEVHSLNIIPTLTHAEIEGVVTDLDTVNETFKLGTLSIDYTSAYFEDNNEDQLSDGIWVEVEGAFANGMMTAQEIEIELGQSFGSSETEVEGYITYVNSTFDSFTINNRFTVYTDSRTEFDDGVQTDLSVGDLVEVDIISTSQGLWAEEVDFETGGSSSNNANSNASTAYFSIEGMATKVSNTLITINGNSFTVNSQTEFDDGLSLSTIDGAWVDIEGSVLTNGSYLAREIEPENQHDGEIEFTGQVSNGSIWGYNATDSSLSAYNGMWVEVECQFNGSQLSNCYLDD